MKIINKFSREEEIANALSHGLGIPLSIIALVFLSVKGVKANSSLSAVGFIVFGISLFIMYTMSTLYHSLRPGRAKRVFERLDHCSIYILIAGTYTPFCFTLLKGKAGWILFGFQWGLALMGIVFKSIWIDKWVAAATAVYAAMGWSIIFVIQTLLASIAYGGFLLLLIGGILYTLGIIFFALPLFKYHHGVWHFFVLGGSITHFFCIYLYL
ncbi:hemolysin III family protein [uncultured Ilyobacter sp.]|uniref:PAQR family membrane homeostasis protein TrhA n=1 Tax=uncultured Ilyobacter sp. TaxID=544433 RepID=UPI0029C0A094|nr:hemolysin III family protein [uncultured Ilyobacter sp.]